MKNNWLWDKKITDAKAKKIINDPDSAEFLSMAALLLARKNNPQEVFGGYLEPLVFCKRWLAIKRKMRQDKWTEPRIVFWQAIYEKLTDKYRNQGISFRQSASKKGPFCESIGKKLAGIRREEALSQSELAEKIGVSQQLVSRIEKGGENISLTSLANIARALKKRVEINFIA